MMRACESDVLRHDNLSISPLAHWFVESMAVVPAADVRVVFEAHGMFAEEACNALHALFFSDSLPVPGEQVNMALIP